MDDDNDDDDGRGGVGSGIDLRRDIDFGLRHGFVQSFRDFGKVKGAITMF